MEDHSMTWKDCVLGLMDDHRGQAELVAVMWAQAARWHDDSLAQTLAGGTLAPINVADCLDARGVPVPPGVAARLEDRPRYGDPTTWVPVAGFGPPESGS